MELLKSKHKMEVVFSLKVQDSLHGIKDERKIFDVSIISDEQKLVKPVTYKINVDDSLFRNLISLIL